MKSVFQVVFVSPVSIAAHPKINEWLTLVEKEMRVTLAKLLAAAVKDTYEFKAGKLDPEQYLVWVDKYQVIFQFFYFKNPCLSA